MEESLGVDQEDHFFPNLLVSTLGIFLRPSWPFTILPTLSTFIEEADGHWSSFLNELSFTLSLHPGQWDQTAVPRSSLEGGQMASPFWLSHEAVLSQHCPCIHKDHVWPPANSFISQLVRTHAGNRAAMYY